VRSSSRKPTSASPTAPMRKSMAYRRHLLVGRLEGLAVRLPARKTPNMAREPRRGARARGRRLALPHRGQQRPYAEGIGTRTAHGADGRRQLGQEPNGPTSSGSVSDSSRVRSVRRRAARATPRRPPRSTAPAAGGRACAACRDGKQQQPTERARPPRAWPPAARCRSRRAATEHLRRRGQHPGYEHAGEAHEVVGGDLVAA
jgi:hypothetical protein